MSADLSETAIPVEPNSLADNVGMLRPDHVLEDLQALANGAGVGLSVTLVVDGIVVQGNIASGLGFFEHAAQAISDSNGDADAAPVVEGLARLFMDEAAVYSDLRISEEAEQFPPRFLHLNDAQILIGSRFVSVGPWRARLTSISGWSLGRRE